MTSMEGAEKEPGLLMTVLMDILSLRQVMMDRNLGLKGYFIKKITLQNVHEEIIQTNHMN